MNVHPAGTAEKESLIFAVAVLGVAEDDLLIVTVSGKIIRIQTKQVRASGRATQGVRLINLEDKVCSVAKASES